MDAKKNGAREECVKRSKRIERAKLEKVDKTEAIG